jgi:CDGSH-type Zn-finger protein
MTKSKSGASVVILKDGPYLVSGNVPLSRQTIVTDEDGGSEAWKEGGTFPAQESYALCRCGQSKKTPFCDGTHTRVKFDGSETASREPYLKQAKLLDGPVLALTDAESLCAFGRFCDPNGQVWNQVAHSDEPKIRAIFIRQVENCPAGRLVAWDKATGKPLERKYEASIGLIEDPAQQCSGPLWLRGEVPVISADGFAYEVRNRVTLCRCGQSRSKPFCDGTHAAIKFRDA